MRRAALVGVIVAAAVFPVAMVVGGSGSPAPGETERAAPTAEPPATPARAGTRPDGREVFARMGCGSCHRLAAAGATGRIGPSLDERLPHHSPAALRSKIVSPDSTAYSGMPDDFGERMSAAELNALVGFLLRQAR